ncbi:unnamed protein product, partial [Haemonchus placei]|uniref:BPTI/Kunitz inhibitor domain-containing protein n=1 Tax=Haemonchus placei TaxID=6290 RepID=A0A0N4VWV2_HAEPC
MGGGLIEFDGERYFNPARGRCELFYWSGCCGNGNNFQ